MIKITAKLCLLALCLSLVVGVALPSPSKAHMFNAAPDGTTSDNAANDGGASNNNEGNDAKKADGTTSDNAANDGSALNNNEGNDAKKADGTTNDNEANNGGALNNNEGDDAKKADGTTSDNAAGNGAAFKGTSTNSSLITKKTDEPLTQQQPPPQDHGIFHTILEAVLGILVVVCLGLMWKNIIRLKDRLKAAEDRLKKIAPSKSDDSHVSEEYTNSTTLADRVSDLEYDNSRFKEVLRDLQKKVDKLQPGEIADNRTLDTAGTKRQLPPPKSIYSSGTDNKPEQISGAIKSSQSHFTTEEITDAYNKMMITVAEARPMGRPVTNLINDFIQKYGLIKFKCTNSQRRMNYREEIPPRFERCSTSETLWCKKLATGNFAVWPAPVEYESNVHLYGGMDELFVSGYTGGSYPKIEVIKPANVTHSFQVTEQGKLRLSR